MMINAPRQLNHMVERTDIAVIGGGIAGTSVASLLSEHGSVVLLVAEAQPGYHATGRSAAYFAPAYGNEVVRALTGTGEDFYRLPPDDFTDVPLLRDRNAVFVDRLNPLEVGETTAQRIRGAKLVTFERGGYLVVGAPR